MVFFESSQGRFLTGSITVEGENNLSTHPVVIHEKPSQHPDVVRAKCGATGSHRCPNASEVRCHDIGVTLNNDRLLFLGNQPLGDVQAIEHIALFIDGCFRAVEVFGSFIVVIKLSRTETNYFPTEFADRPDEPATKPVVDSPISLGNETTCE